MAWRICVLVACGCTTNVYWWSSASAIDFSVIRGETMTSRASIGGLLFGGETIRQRFVGGHRKKETIVAQDVFDVERAVVGYGNALEIAPGSLDRGGMRFTAPADDQRLRTHTRRFGAAEEQLGECGRLFDRELAGVEQRHGVVLEAVGERGQEGDAAFLLIERLHVAARLRSEHDAAMAPLRGANRALARTSGALLPPGLAAAAGDFVALERRCGAGSRIGKLAMDGAIDHGELAGVVAAERGGGLHFLNNLA